MNNRTTIPSEQLYWGVIDTTGFPPIPFATFRPEAVRHRLANQFDAVIPQSVEELHTVYTPIGGHKILACGICRDLIFKIREGGATHANPDRVPDLVQAPADASYINLLCGEYKSIPVVRIRRRQSRLLAAMVVLLALLIGIGNVRRESRYNDSVANARTQQAKLYRTTFGANTGGPPPAVRLTTELRRLSATRGSGIESSTTTDAMLDLQAVFRNWPNDIELRVERLAVLGDRIDIAAEADDTDIFEQLIKSLDSLPGWELPLKRIDRQRNNQTARARLGLERAKPVSKGGRS